MRTVPYLYYSLSGRFFTPGTIVMASHIDWVSDEELLRLGRRFMIGKFYWNNKKFLSSVRSAYSKHGYDWVIASGDAVTFAKSQDFRKDYQMCEHSMRVYLWRARKEREATLARWAAQG